MKRLLHLILTLMIALCAPVALSAQGETKEYRSETLGVAFQYPAAWVVRSGMGEMTVIVAAQADLDALTNGGTPQNVIFSLSLTSFRLLNIQNPDDFAGVLARLAGPGRAAPTPVNIGGAAGLRLTLPDELNNIVSDTAILSVGGRRVAILRGVATLSAWRNGGERQFAQMTETVRFFPPPAEADLDRVGTVLWQRPMPDLPNMVGISVSPSGANLYITDRDLGIYRLNASGTDGELFRPPEIGQFAGILTLRDGNQYLADPGSNTLWLRPVGETAVRRVLGGQVGTGRGAFGVGSPRQFALANRSFYVLDENTNGLRVQVFNLGGTPITFWALSDKLPAGVTGAMIDVDSAGNLYVLAKGMAGLLKLNAAGSILARDLGADGLAGGEPLAFTIDRFDNFYIATADQGILHLDPDGKLVGVIGLPYDESAPPKPGQLGRPVALGFAPNAGLMYVVDAGKYPQIVAFSLDGNTATNLESGTRAGGALAYGQTVQGEITETAFLYTYTFTGQAGEKVTISVAAAGFDAFVDLVRPDGRVAAFNDDVQGPIPGLSATDSQIATYRLPISGEYTIRVTRFGREAARGPNTTGSFILRLEGGAGN